MVWVENVSAELVVISISRFLIQKRALKFLGSGIIGIPMCILGKIGQFGWMASS